MIILFYKLIIVRMRSSIYLKKIFRICVFVFRISFFMFINISLLFIFVIIQIRKKRVYYYNIFKLLNVTPKFKIEIVINNVKLIFNKYYIYIFSWFENFLGVFTRFSLRIYITYNIVFIKDSIDCYCGKLFKFII